MPQRFCPDCATKTEDARCPQCGSITALPGGPEAAHLAGKVLEGRYELLELAGQGGMGTVYRAVDRTLTRPVAVKVLGSATEGDAQLAQRFRQEGRMASRILHPNVIVTFDAGVTAEGWMFLVMELLEGRELSREIRRQTRIEPRRALELAVQIARAVQAAHAQGIVHRDLKPPNIFLVDTPDGEPQVKVMDFGLARVLEGGPYVPRITQAGLVLGSPGYMSPEQVSGLEVDYRTDFYSLGVTLFEMVTGKKPFVGETASHVMVQHLSDPPPPLSGLLPQPNVVAVVQPLLDRLMAKAPEARPADATEALALIQSAQQALQQDAAEEPAGEPTRPMRRVRAPALDELPTVQVSRSDGLANGQAPPSALAATRPDLSRLPARRHLVLWAGGAAAVVAAAVAVAVVARTGDPAVPAVSLAAAPAAGAPRTVLLRVQSQPSGATVRLGATVLGTTPLEERVAVGQKEVPLSLELRGFRGEEMSVTLHEDQMIKLVMVPVEKAPAARKEGARKVRDRQRTSDVNLLEDVP